MIEQAYRTGEAGGLAVWVEDEAGPYQAVPQAGQSWCAEGQPATHPHEYVRGDTAKLLTLFHPGTGELRAKGVTSSANAVLHPWLQGELETVPACLPVPALQETALKRGMPPSLAVVNTDSLGEQIQRNYPGLRVVKTPKTMKVNLMVNPRQLAEGDHTVCVSGNDAPAKAQVTQFLQDWFGWREVIDLGDITTARGVEMYLPLWLELFGALQKPLFNIKLVQSAGA